MKNTKFKTVKYLSSSLCRSNPDKLFVFGDNLIQKGKKGQAQIRDESNSFGVPTKRLPCLREDCFFADRKDEFNAVEDSIFNLISLGHEYEIILPEDGIGTGLAEMDVRSPKLFNYMNKMLGYSY